jgi:hypothetical protein
VYWIDYEESTWEPWRNTFALFNFLKEKNLSKLIPKMKYVDSDEEWEVKKKEKN